MWEANLEEVETYALRLQDTISQYIATRPVLEFFLEAEEYPGSWVTWRLWGKESLDLESVRMLERAAELEAEEWTEGAEERDKTR